MAVLLPEAVNRLERQVEDLIGHPKDDYDQTLGSDRDMIWLSIAISLRRIADTLNDFMR